jgi:phosphomannomutase
MNQKIQFGTDGWRATIADTYTFDNVRRCTQGFALYLLEIGKSGQRIVIGYDKRFHSENFAKTVSEVMAANGFEVFLTDSPTPTPVISYSVVVKKACGAINITASHNPPVDNGFKVRDENGGAIAPEGLKRIEALIPNDIDAVKVKSFAAGQTEGNTIYNIFSSW